MIKGEGVPSYFKKGWRERRWSRIANVKVEKVRGSRYWEEKEGGKDVQIVWRSKGIVGTYVGGVQRLEKKRGELVR